MDYMITDRKGAVPDLIEPLPARVYLSAANVIQRGLGHDPAGVADVLDMLGLRERLNA